MGIRVSLGFQVSAYYLYVMHERVARSTLRQVFFLLYRGTKEQAPPGERLSAWKTRETAAN